MTRPLSRAAYADEPDGELARRVAGGEHGAFEALTNTCGPRIRASTRLGWCSRAATTRWRMPKTFPSGRLAAEPFLMREPGSGTRMIALRFFARRGLAPRIRMELSTDEAIREAILAGLGVSILSRYSLGLEPARSGLVCLDVEGFPLESHWHFVYPVGKRLSFAARAFMDYTRIEAKSLFRDALRSASAQTG